MKPASGVGDGRLAQAVESYVHHARFANPPRPRLRILDCENEEDDEDTIIGRVLIWRGARIVPNPQRLDGSACIRFPSSQRHAAPSRRDQAVRLRVGTTRVLRGSAAEGGWTRSAGQFEIQISKPPHFLDA